MKKRNPIQDLRRELAEVRRQRDEAVANWDRAEVRLRQVGRSLEVFTSAAEVASMFLDIGDRPASAAVLMAIRMARVRQLQEQISVEPGGINYKTNNETKED